MRRILFFCWILLTTTYAFSQAALPTSWDCTTGTTPAYWTTNSTTYYTSASYIHSAPNALKFEFTGAYLTINFADEPDSLVYYLRGASMTGGTYLVQQSADGTSWTTLRTFTDANIPNSSLASASPFVDHLASTTRFVRFYYSFKSSGNVSLDDISISKKAAGPNAEIAFKINHVLVQTGQTAVTGNISAVPCLVFNGGLDSVLKLTGYVITGTDAGMFSLSGLPSLVNPGDSTSFTINFTPGGADGTKTATLTLNNNDSDENPFVIYLWAVKGCCATEPSNAAVNLAFSQITSYGFRVGFADGMVVPERYIVLKKSSPITESPVDGQTYVKGCYIGNAQVCYNGPAAYFYPSDVVAGTTYYLKVFPVNGYPGYENYYTNSPASGSVSSLSNMIGTYYDLLNLQSGDIRSELHNLINPHNTLFYADYGTTLLATVEYRDTVESGHWRKMVKCAYSNIPYIYADPFAWTVLSRDHNFCQSWMPTVGDANFDQLPEYSDYHNLAPINQNHVNSYRNNYPMGEVDSITYQYGDCKMGYDTAGNMVFEPRDDAKGDCARSMLYMVVCYDGISGYRWKLPDTIGGMTYGQDLSVLKSWNHSDPPSAYEMARNDYIYSIQGNRNPFIDSLQWVDQIDFSIFSGISETAVVNPFRIFPNPATDEIFINRETTKKEAFSLILCNYVGATVMEWPIGSYNQGIRISRGNLPSGLYIYHIRTANGEEWSGKLILS